MIAIVYYSLSGTTAAAADKFTGMLNAERIEIKDIRSRRGLIGFIRSGYEALTAKLPSFKTVPGDLTVEQLKAYDGIILMSPIWAGHISSMMRSFLNRYGAGVGRYALAVMSGDPQNEYTQARDDVEAICGHPAFKFASFCAKSGDLDTRLTEFGEEVGALIAKGGEDDD